MAGTELKRQVTLVTPEVAFLAHVLEAQGAGFTQMAKFKEVKEQGQYFWVDPIHHLFSPYFPAGIPFADIRAKAEGFWKPGFWLCADPVIFQADLNQVICLGQKKLVWPEDEAKAAFTRLEALVREDGYELHYGSAQRWYFYSATPLEIESHSLQNILGISVSDRMPKGSSAKYLTRLMTEAQMLFQSTAVVQTERARGLVAVLGPWFWGEGKLAEIKASKQVTCWSEKDFLLEAIADAIPVKWQECPSEPQTWLKNLLPGQHCLILNNEQGLEAWVPFLLEAVKKRQIDLLDLVVRENKSIELTQKDLMPWWKRFFNLI